MSHPPFPDQHLVRLAPGSSILFDCVEAAAPATLDFDIWWASQHLPAGSRPDLRRYAAPAHSAYISIQELSTESQPESVQPQSLPRLPVGLRQHMRCLGQPLGGAYRHDSGPHALEAPYAYPIFFNVPAQWWAQFNDWYDSEHIPMLLQCPQWLMCRRFQLDELADCPWTHMALHYLSDLRALQSPERAAARSTPWRRELDRQPWFKFTHRLGNRLA